MTVNDNQPGTNPPPPDAIEVTLGSGQRRYVERALALADAGDAGRVALAELTGCGTEDPAVVYASGFGAARVLIRNLLDVIGELAESLRVYDEDDGREPYCTACGEWIGQFRGLEGWRHYRGDPGPGGHRELYDTGHEAVPGSCQPPGRALSPAGLAVVRQALADAAAWRTSRTEGDRDADTAQAVQYEGLLRRLVTGEDVA